MNHRGPSLSRNAVTNWVALAVNIGVGFVITPLIISHVGKPQYGMWALVWTVVGYYGLLNMGVSTAIVRQVARSLGERDTDSASETATNALALLILAGALAIVLTALLAHPLAGFFAIGPDRQQQFVTVVWLVGILAGVSLPGNLPSAVLRAGERFVPQNVVVIFSELLRLALYAAFLKAGRGIVGIAWASMITTLIKFASHWVMWYILMPEVRVRLRLINGAGVRSLLAFGFFVWLTQASNVLIIQLDAVVVGRFLNVESVAVYAVAALIIRHFFSLGSSLNSVVIPRLSRIVARESRGVVNARFLAYTNIEALAGFGIALLIGLFAPSFIGLWVGPGFEGSAVVLYALLAGAVVDFATATSYAAVIATARHRVYAWATLAEGLVNVILSLALVRPLGMAGVALGTTIPRILFKGIVLPIFAAHYMGVPALRFFAVSLGKPLAAAALVASVAMATGLWGAYLSPVTILAGALGATALYAAASFAVGANDDVRRKVRRVIAVRWGAIRA